MFRNYVISGFRSSRDNLLFSKCLLRRDNSQGFTLFELLVVMIIAGVLAAIAAPGWLAFMNRQRVGGAQTKLLQLVREAQADSISKRSSYGVEFDGQNAKRFSAKGIRTNGTQSLTKAINDDGDAVAYIGDENLAPGDDTELEILTSDGNPARIYFNFDGSVPTQDIAVPYTISVQIKDQPSSRRCVIVETLLGSMREAKGVNDCPASS